MTLINFVLIDINNRLVLDIRVELGSPDCCVMYLIDLDSPNWVLIVYKNISSCMLGLEFRFGYGLVNSMAHHGLQEF